MRSKNEAVSQHTDATLRHLYREQYMSVDKLCRSQTNAYCKLARIELDKVQVGGAYCQIYVVTLETHPTSSGFP